VPDRSACTSRPGGSMLVAQVKPEVVMRNLVPPLVTRSVARYSGTVAGSVGSDTVNTRYRAASVELPLRDTACSAPGGS